MIKEIIEGNKIKKEYESLIKESKKSETKGYDSLENFQITIPNRVDVNESVIYDLELIQKIKNVFKEWKTGWTEVNKETGDELDVEMYIESANKPFFDR